VYSQRTTEFSLGTSIMNRLNTVTFGRPSDSGCTKQRKKREHTYARDAFMEG
jgi:hypothetical protein